MKIKIDLNDVPLAAIVLAGFGLRLAWMITQTQLITMEGSEYVRMAENLTHGRGLVGNFEGAETMYAPLFSLLTAGVMFVTRNGEAAAHLVALLFGTALIVIVFFAGRLMYGERAAHICAALVAFHPLLVKLSASIYNESLYLTLFMAAIYCGMRALELRSSRDALLLGVFLGLAYLSRPEAFAYPMFFVLALCIAGLTRRKMGMAAQGMALLLGAFFVLGSPYAVFLYQHTGHVRIEGKSNINYTNARRVLGGMTFNEAAFGIDESLNMKGTLLVPSQFADYTPYPTSMLERGRTMLKLAQLNRSAVYEEFRSPKIGSPVLLFLVVLGLFRKPWSHRRLLQETVLMVMAASILILLLMATVETNFRYFFPLVPLLLLWAGMGMEQLGQWARGLARLNRELLPPSKIVGAGVQIIAASMMVLLSAWGTRSAYEFAMQQVDRSATRDAGLWLRQYSPGPKRVAARLTIFPYYAEATLVQFPYANEELTQRYLDAKQVDFVVLESQYAGNWPTIEAWIAHGIPDDHARVVYDVKNASGDRVVIYSWQQVR